MVSSQFRSWSNASIDKEVYFEYSDLEAAVDNSV
jgi:hypothetical protein